MTEVLEAIVKKTIRAIIQDGSIAANPRHGLKGSVSVQLLKMVNNGLGDQDGWGGKLIRERKVDECGINHMGVDNRSLTAVLLAMAP